jgi:hypothetical protein
MVNWMLDLISAIKQGIEDKRLQRRWSKLRSGHAHWFRRAVA